MPATQSLTVSPTQVAQFSALAAQWWDPAGPMRPLHQMNPTRVGWIDSRIRTELAAGAASARILDIGCGAGLLSESLARLGYQVLGVDPSAEAIEAAQTHAAGAGLPLSYRAGPAEDLVGEGTAFDVVTALEVIEHVDEPDRFLAMLGRLVAPGGLVFISTLNRTPLAFLTAKLGAEYLLRMLPVGTHDWQKFVSPTELGAGLRRAGLHLADIAGLVPDPLRGGWRVGRSVAVNYIAMARRN